MFIYNMEHIDYNMTMGMHGYFPHCTRHSYCYVDCPSLEENKATSS